MVAAKIRFLKKQSTREAAKESLAPQSQIGQAAVVLEYAPELAWY